MKQMKKFGVLKMNKFGVLEMKMIFDCKKKNEFFFEMGKLP